MPDTQNKILKFTQNHLPNNIAFEIYVDTECLFLKVSSSDNSPTKSFKKQTNKTSYGYSIFMCCLFNAKKGFKRCEDVLYKSISPRKKNNLLRKKRNHFLDGGR